jgi:hypothetical protein
MFRLRQQQVDAFENESRERFRERLAVFFRSSLPERTTSLSDSALRERIADGDQRARTYGLVTEQGIAHFVGLSLIMGPCFDEHPAINGYLQSRPEVRPERKIEALTAALADHSLLASIMRAGGKGW